MPTRQSHNNRKYNIRYAFLLVVVMLILVLSAAFTEGSVSSASDAGFLGDTPTNVWTVVKSDAVKQGTPEPNTSAKITFFQDNPTTIFLPIIMKRPYRFDPDGTLIVEALWKTFTLPVISPNILITLTPPDPTSSVTPGTGSPTAKPSITATSTGTPTPEMIPDGDFEGGGDQSQTRWRVFSLRDHRVIFDDDLNQGLPELPVSPFSGSAMAWLGGDDSELTYIETDFFLPADKPFIWHQYYLYSEDPTCATDIFSDLTVRTQFRFANANSLNNLQSDVGGLIITDGVNEGVFVLDLCARDGTFITGSIVYDTSFFAGKNVTIRFQTVNDLQITSSWFIDDVSVRGDFSPTIINPFSTDNNVILLEPKFIITPVPMEAIDTVSPKPVTLENSSRFQK